ncbi:hypothetical protein EMIHUDRAFT_214042 [Emiliania huxleyi CCMP1516]|uniref:6-phosphofructo-2-kinase domain-containing protein n=2 Tax=Emiliania huxleyi TaxID=2903 RepID=A0A0D3ILS1_EMIH1|nr:hypothetical protein EMIHUDRAFT_214042 [Emiliania huxleyi CCMP1516]EOD12206.1 hypothetical protein EMIHUDRAFT_214042 [Emiliania huxleyi CCMP1516]|eukprot:XP_005764635.1 hypothetical protein EMIHUDRAFT_214042 [Emiliania huxleyi CCMP1516]
MVFSRRPSRDLNAASQTPTTAADGLGFPTTQSLLDALPSPKLKGDGSASGKKSVTGHGWAPRHGGDEALLVAKALKARPDLARRARGLAECPRLLLVLVGLPARGKSILADKLERFLNWRGWKTGAFSAGACQREGRPLEGEGSGGAAFFDSANVGSSVARGKIANAVLKEALSFLDTGGEIAIFDSSNASKDRRAMLSESVHAHGEATGRPIAIVFVESILTSPTLLLANMKAKVRASPDFYALHEPAAMESLKQRIVHYERDYESCSEEEGPYIKLFDLSSKAHAPHPARASPHLLSAHNPHPLCSPTPSPGKVEASHIYGRVSSSVLPYLLSITFVARPVALVSVPDNDDTGNFAAALAAWAEDHAGPLQVISSTHPAAMAAAARVAQAKEAQSPSHGRKTAFACDEHGERGWPASSCPRNAACHDMSTTCPVRGGEQGLASVGPPIHFAELLPSSLGSGDSPPTSFEERAALGAGTSPKDLVRRLEPSAPLLESLHASSSAGAAALADDATSLVELTPSDKIYGFAESIVSLARRSGIVGAGSA